MNIAKGRGLVVLNGEGLFLLSVRSENHLQRMSVSDSPFIILSSSSPIRSRLIFKDKASLGNVSASVELVIESAEVPTCMARSEAASFNSGTISKPNLLANLTHRITRSGSSLNVSFGGSGVRIMPSRRSFSPCHTTVILLYMMDNEICYLFSEVLHGTTVNIVEKRIDSDVSSQGILKWSTKHL